MCKKYTRVIKPCLFPPPITLSAGYYKGSSVTIETRTVEGKIIIPSLQLAAPWRDLSTTYSLQTASWETWALAKGNLFTRQYSWLSRCSAQLQRKVRIEPCLFLSKCRLERENISGSAALAFHWSFSPSKAGLFPLAFVLFIVRMRPTSRLHFPLLLFLRFLESLASWPWRYFLLLPVRRCLLLACIWQSATPAVDLGGSVLFVPACQLSGEFVMRGFLVHRRSFSSCQCCESPIPEVPTWCLRSVLPQWEVPRVPVGNRIACFLMSSWETEGAVSMTPLTLSRQSSCLWPLQAKVVSERSGSSVGSIWGYLL